MNRIHRTDWSRAHNASIAVSEIIPSQGKEAQGGSGSVGVAESRGPSGRLTWLCQSVLGAGLVAMFQMSHALPQNGQLNGGSATIVQTNQNASLNWKTYQVRWTERVTLQQPDNSAIAYNRIADTSASQILSSVSANGQMSLINPNGIVLGAGAQVSVDALVPGLSGSALAQASKTFSSAGTGYVTNLGTLQAAPGSFVALIANQGSIQAPGGTVALGASAQVTLQFADNQLLGLTVDRNTLGNLADNQQLIQADDGQVILSAGARDSVLAGVVNNSGRVQARTLQDIGGVGTLVGGQVQQFATLDVSAPTLGNARLVDRAAVLDDGHINASRGSREQ